MIHRGMALVVSGGVPAAVRLPDSFFMLTGARLLGADSVPSLCSGSNYCRGFVLHKTSYGFKVYAVRAVQRGPLGGINTDRVRITNFVIIGVISGWQAYSMSYYSVTPTVGQGIETQVIAATVLGGTSMLGVSVPSSALCWSAGTGHTS